MFRYTVTTNTEWPLISPTVLLSPSRRCLRLPAVVHHRIAWLIVLITECLATVILNIVTIIVFVKQRQLQRRSTYLIIHLVFVDFLVGAISGPLTLAERMASFCNLWKNPFGEHATYIRSPLVIQSAFTLWLYFISILNLAVISLERLHATFCPLKHPISSRNGFT